MNIKNVEGLFNRMRQIYEFILVITHNDDIKSYTDVDLPIEKREGYSYINMKD
jgi:DNA repair exonuclease SbcCD ATPase subunit